MAYNNNNNVPEEVVVDILSRLPADTLVRFKSVNKSWYALMESPQFVKMQCHNHVHSPSSNNDNSPHLLVKSSNFVDPADKRSVLWLVAYDGRLEATSDGEDASYTVKNVFSKDGAFMISCQCDGIICLRAAYVKNHTIVLANPGIRQFRVLPESCIPLLMRGNHQPYVLESFRETVGVGFGLDLKTNDYKVVRILEFGDPDPSVLMEGDVRAEVYSLRSNSWRQIEFLDTLTHINRSQYTSFLCYWNGAYYWPAKQYQTDHYLLPRQYQPIPPSVRGILSFNFSNETFQFTRLPGFVSNLCFWKFVDFEIVVFNGNLALITYCYCKQKPRPGQYFDIWVMDEFGVNGTWTKLLSTGPLPEVERPLVFWKSDELLVLLSSGQVASYNLVTNQMKNLPIYGTRRYLEAVIYKSSLISICDLQVQSNFNL